MGSSQTEQVRSPSQAAWSAARFLYDWLPVAAWMLVIFISSSQPTMPGPPEPWLDFLIKKMAHVATYALLAALIWRALHFSRGALLWALLLTALYGASDEFHQSLVPPREPAIRDIAIDTFGGFLGLLAVQVCSDLYAAGRRRLLGR